MAWKPSFYNHLIPYQHDNAILFNASTLGLAIISAEQIPLVNKLIKADFIYANIKVLPENEVNSIDTANLNEAHNFRIENINQEFENIQCNSKFVESLVYGGFLVDKEFNEKQFISKRLKKARNKKNSLELTIAPTIGCNFNCAYCFESEDSRANFLIMPEDIQQHLFSFVERFIKEHHINSLNVTWFGGEPLLAMKAIESLSKKFIDLTQTNNIFYSANIITNGYKLTEQNIHKLIACQVTHAQITLDGPEHIHDKRRFLKNGKASYQIILNNIENALANGLDINIRINIDQENYQGITTLLDDLDRRNVRKKISVYLGYIASEYSNFSQKISHLLGKTFANLQLELKNSISEEGKTQIELPTVITNACGADSESHFMVGPSGELYQCWEDVGDFNKTVGNIYSTMQENQNYVSEYMEFDPTTHPKCSNCQVMTLCMGGCPKQRLQHNGEPQCGVYKYNLADWIASYVDQQLQSPAINPEISSQAVNA
jgi:uncharacterized protein